MNVLTVVHASRFVRLKLFPSKAMCALSMQKPVPIAALVSIVARLTQSLPDQFHAKHEKRRPAVRVAFFRGWNMQLRPR
jgi:hypothetical protein